MATWTMSVQRRVMLFIALLSMAPLLRAAAPAEVVRDLAYQIQAAVDARDTTRLAALLSPSFIAISTEGGITSRADFLSDLGAAPADASGAQLEREWRGVQVSVNGDSAIFVGRTQWTPKDKGDSRRATYSTVVTQQWHSAGGRWQLESQQRTRLPPMPVIVTFRSGSLTLKGMLFLPQGKGPFPAIVYAHGNEPDPTNLFESVAPGLVARGYAVWAPHRRGSGLSSDAAPNLLRTLSEIERREGVAARSRYAIQQLEGPQLDDLAAAVAEIKRSPWVDANRVFLMGNSFGGVLALLAAERDIGVRATADFAGAAMNWERSAAFRERMTRAAEHATCPVFLAQAANDFSTAPTVELDKIMTASGKNHRAKVFPPFGLTALEGHGFGIDGVDQWAEEVLPFLENAASEH